MLYADRLGCLHDLAFTGIEFHGNCSFPNLRSVDHLITLERFNHFVPRAEIEMKRLESPPSGHFMIVARVPVAPPTIRRHIVSKTKPGL